MGHTTNFDKPLSTEIEEINSNLTPQIMSKTMSTKITNTSIQVYKIGKIVFVVGWFVVGSTAISGSETIISGLPQAKTETSVPYNSESNSSAYILASATEIKTGVALGAGTSHSFNFIYICN